MRHQQRNSSPWSIDNFMKTTAFSRAVELLNEQITEDSKSVTTRSKVVRLIMFAIYRGGLARQMHLAQLVKLIVSNELVIQICPIGPYIEFEPLEQEKTGNEGFHRWFIDTGTLAAIHALWIDKGKYALAKSDEKSLFKLVKTHFAMVPEFAMIKSLKALCETGVMYASEHRDINLPAYLVNVATGKTSTTSVSHSCWRAFWQAPGQNSVNGEQLQVDTDTSRSSNQTIQNPRIADKNFLSRLRFAIKGKDEYGSAIPLATTLDHLRKLKSLATALPQTILLEFIEDGLKAKSWKRSSAGTYLSHVGSHWLSLTNNLDLTSLNEYCMTELFEELLTIAKDNISQADKVSILKQLFVFGSEIFNTALPVFDDISVSKVHNIRNYVISEANFTRFINSISAADSNQNLQGQGLVLSAILMARCGLRPSEVLKLRLKDIEPSDQHCIFIRANRFGTNKSHSARRKIPLSLLLLPDEFDLFKKYFKRRQLDTKKELGLLLFSCSDNANLPYSLSDFHYKFSDRLSQVCGERVHTYHLRHKALSTLQVVLTSDTLESFIPYSDYHTQQIRRFFAVESGRDTLYEVAAFAGHLSPQTTFKNYFHFTDVILYKYLTSNDDQHDRRYWENLSALSKHLITRRCTNSAPKRDEIQMLLLEALCGKGSGTLSTVTKKDSAFQPVHPERKITYVDCLTALEYLEKGETIQQVAEKLDIEDAVIEEWYSRAIDAAGLKTTKGKSRLFPSKSNNRSSQILPVRPASNAELKRADKAVASARKLYHSHQAELVWFIHRVITTAMNSQSYLKFDDTEECYSFMAFALRFTGANEWQLELDMPKEDKSLVKAKWKRVSPDMCVKVSCAQVVSGKFKKGRARLYFLHPQKLKSDGDRYSSNTIKYVCHILAIMIPGVMGSSMTVAA